MAELKIEDSGGMAAAGAGGYPSGTPSHAKPLIRQTLFWRVHIICKTAFPCYAIKGSYGADTDV